MDGEDASDGSPQTLDSLDRKTTGSAYNIPFANIDHAVFSANENVEFPKDRNVIKKAEDYRNLGNESFKRGFLESAIDYYTKAIKTYPYNHEFYTNRALCYKKQRKWDCVSGGSRAGRTRRAPGAQPRGELGQGALLPRPGPAKPG